MKYAILIVLVLVGCPASIKKATAQEFTRKYRVQFRDKADSPYSLSDPYQFLSVRAIQRRLNQNIPIAENDLPVNPHYIDSICMIGVKVLNRSKWFNAITIEVSDSSILEDISSCTFVTGIQQVYGFTGRKSRCDKLVTGSESGIPVEPASYYGYSTTQIKMMNGHILHGLGYLGEGMLIAILDAGFIGVDYLPAFDHLRSNSRIIVTRDFVDGDGEVYDAHDHGMVVTSILAGQIPSALYGTAPEASYLLLRSEDTGSEFLIEEDNWISAAEYADSFGVDLINSSLGYSTFDDPGQDHKYSDMNGNSTRISIGADIAASKGILVVNSAGNAGDDPWLFITAPADADSILAVGAVDHMRQYAPFSSTGPSFDGRIKPDIAAMGQGAWFMSVSGLPASGNGTSLSAPLVTGLAACLWQANPSLTNMEILKTIEETASQFNSPDSLLGYGIPDFAAALYRIGFPLPKKYCEITTVYPNPFIDQLFVELFTVTRQDVMVQMIDLTGRLIRVEKFGEIDAGSNPLLLKDLGTLPMGCYIIKIITREKTLETKVIKL